MDDGTSEQPRCEVCGDPIRRNNVIGVCANPGKPECVKEGKSRSEKRRTRNTRPRPEPAHCEVCGCPLNPSNRSGICHGHGKPACAKARKERAKEANPKPAPHRIVISVGDRFGRWTALEDYSLDNRRILVRCECGTEKRLSGQVLANGHSLGCRHHGTPKRDKPPYIPAGAAFGRITVLEDVLYSRDKARCRCTCGTEKMVLSTMLVHGKVRSCGCLKREMRSSLGGFSKHPLYSTWNGMMDRCTQPNHASYASYGGRGIMVCERWRDPWVFAEDIEREIGPRPAGVSKNGWSLFSLDRYPDNDGNYEPGNVRWATMSEQVLNQRKVRTLTTERAALAAQIEDLTAQIQVLTAQIEAPRKRKVPSAPQDATLF